MSFVVASLEGGNKIMKSSIGPSKLFEVNLETLTEGFPAHLVYKLLKQACTLAVSDTIDQRFWDICVFTLSFNIMVWGKKIFCEAPALVSGKVKPWFFLEFFNERTTKRASVIWKSCSKTFIKPKVVPPLHSDKISEPHMGKLMLNDNTEESELRDWHMLAWAHDPIWIGDASNILHRTKFVVWAHNMVYLREGITMSISLLV